jgi:hypothetical protein
MHEERQDEDILPADVRIVAYVFMWQLCFALLRTVYTVKVPAYNHGFV